MYGCELCPKTYRWPDSLRRHLKYTHANDGTQNDSNDTAGISPIKKAKILTDMQISKKPIVFQHPFTMAISGPTSSGKTYLVKNILESDKIMPKPDRIMYLYKRWQPLYDEMQKTVPNIEFIKGIPEDIDQDGFFDVQTNNMLILDDMMSTTAVDPKITDLFTEGSHHRNLDVINLTQNVFPPGKNAVSQRRNTQYMIIFKSPMSQDQIRTIGSFMFPGQLDQFLRVYQEATEKPHGYLVIDAKQNTPVEERFKTNIFQNEVEVNDVKYVLAPPGYPPDGAIFHCADCDLTHDNEEVFDKHTCGQSIGMELGDKRFFCPDCKVTYSKLLPLVTHRCRQKQETDTKSIKVEHLAIQSHLSDDRQSDNMAESKVTDNKSHACVECGALYNNGESLFKHIKQCGTYDSDDDGSVSDSESESESVWGDMVQQVYDENDKEFQEKVQTYEDQGIEDARGKASDDLRPAYKRDLQGVFFNLFKDSFRLTQSSHYHNILEDFNYFVHEKNYGKRKALKAAIRKNNDFFDELLDDSESENSDTESGTSDTSKSNDSDQDEGLEGSGASDME